MTENRNRWAYNLGPEKLTHVDKLEGQVTLTLASRRVYQDPKTGEIVSEERWKIEKVPHA